MGYLKGKSALLIFQRWGNMKFTYRNEGKVVKYNRERGFGFILDFNTNNNLFFHISNFPFNEARIGQKVKYEIANSPKGQNAINIKVI